MAESDLPRMRLTGSAAGGEEPRVLPNTESFLPQSTLLIVDDNPQNVELLQAFLESLPVRIVTARFAVVLPLASRWYPRRVTAFALRGVMTMAYLADGDVLQQIGATPNTDPFGLGDEVPAPTVSGERLKVDLAAHLAELDHGEQG